MGLKNIQRLQNSLLTILLLNISEDLLSLGTMTHGLGTVRLGTIRNRKFASQAILKYLNPVQELPEDEESKKLLVVSKVLSEMDMLINNVEGMSHTV